MQALFGSYHSVLESRGDSILAAAMSAWEPYVRNILDALDNMRAGAAVERPLLVRLVDKKTFEYVLEEWRSYRGLLKTCQQESVILYW